MTNILVTGASSLIGYGILNSIRSLKKPYNIIGSTIHKLSIASSLTDVCIEAPICGSEGYIDWFLKVIKDHHVDLVIPSFEEDVIFLSNNRKKIESTGVKVVLNNFELVQLCNDKWAFYRVLESNNCPYVIPSSLSSDFNELRSDFGLPLLLKPRQGSASKGIVKIYKQETFELYKEGIGKKLMAQPLIGKDEEEFTSGAFCDGNGGYYGIITFKRKLAEKGYTNEVEVFKSEKIEKAVLDICEILRPVGPTNFQFRFHNGEPKLLEINPRFSSSTSLRTAFGFNDTLMAIEYYLKGKIPKQPKIKQGKAIRYIEDYVFYS
ncbi:ATP-grasp domain-containing protein [Maribacter polysaccharolyticus]|uniref:ATP-grasp domain-containing protein n=1 Tax=Maribacter polysaccharolyticus TaxID=3020831 RepID=UPI00237F62FD|nr:ATP-grasp domain-containing protein [Maribacter polysaccharolyticus]MDE3743530.1 ATP-grasp domain-containing protein [Maribacter polysaccharolyticus]